jgi:hypothetical protein
LRRPEENLTALAVVWERYQDLESAHPGVLAAVTDRIARRLLKAYERRERLPTTRTVGTAKANKRSRRTDQTPKGKRRDVSWHTITPRVAKRYRELEALDALMKESPAGSTHRGRDSYRHTSGGRAF